MQTRIDEVADGIHRLSIALMHGPGFAGGGPMAMPAGAGLSG